jgi:phosphoglucosamine mutase
VLPTPAIAFLTADLEADLGVMLSASHNAMPDNGIKFFARGGHKLADDIEDAIEARMGEPWERPTGAGVGRVRPLADGRERYLAHLLAVLPHRLDGLHVVVDAAHGAASTVAPTAFEQAGARVSVIGCEPDGLNINDGYGSTHLENLQRAVVEHGADLGIALDGDADRCLAVDATGADVDGDQIMAVLPWPCASAAVLAKDTLVATVMSNLGMLQALEREGVGVRQAAVGDRYVLEEMKAGQLSLGGEQSGHVIFLEHGTTGDGTLTGLMLASRLARPAAACRPRRGDDPAAAGHDQRQGRRQGPRRRRPAVQSAVREVEQELGEAGGCCCASPAPSRSCGSWSRRTRPGGPSSWPSAWPGVVREHLALGNR